MEKFICTNCGYLYDPYKGDPDREIEPDTPFEDLPDEWVCPICYSKKELFDPV